MSMCWPTDLLHCTHSFFSQHLQVQYSTIESSKERVMERKENRNKNCVATSQVKQHGRVHDINHVGLCCLFRMSNFFFALSDQMLKAFVSVTW